ncbi:SDR family NAD(P)-dependent oxidoreductase [Castellaniella sp.]|uniref:SDR family NAD(P)-dependent oxidoreductase n=1 Tax=Castellaniella sp. TaxID=1955812 RepID=UPI00355EF4AE
MASEKARIVVITGGASGIGAACAQCIQREGWLPVVADLNFEQAQVVAEQVGGHAIALDVGDENSVEAAAARTEAEIGPVWGLVNSAGIAQAPQRPHDFPLHDWDRIQRIDLRGTYLTCLAFSRAMLERSSGAIVNISSIAGAHSMPLHSYSPAKAAIINMTQCLATEWGPSGIRVNSVAPGYTLTPLLQDQIDRGLRQVDGALQNTPLGGLVRPEQIAEAVLFLLSDRASAITGVNLPVDGGWSVGTTWDMYGGLRGR